MINSSTTVVVESADTAEGSPRTVTGSPQRANVDGGGGEECPVLYVIREIDALLDVARLLTRTCERQGLHKETHVLELGSELLLRRRNYLLNVSSSSQSANGLLPYEAYPCENCYFTYSSAFLISWLDRLLTQTAVVLDWQLCRRSCNYHFGTSSCYAHVADGVLYPMGAPFVTGPVGSPPGSTSDGGMPSTRLVGELDEIKYLGDSFGVVLDALRTKQQTNGYGSVEVDLAERAMNLLQSRRHFGFDMDCVENPVVELCRAQLFDILQSYESRVAAESLNLVVLDVETLGCESRGSGHISNG